MTSEPVTVQRIAPLCHPTLRTPWAGHIYERSHPTNPAYCICCDRWEDENIAITNRVMWRLEGKGYLCD